MAYKKIGATWLVTQRGFDGIKKSPFDPATRES